MKKSIGKSLRRFFKYVKKIFIKRDLCFILIFMFSISVIFNEATNNFRATISIFVFGLSSFLLYGFYKLGKPLTQSEKKDRKQIKKWSE